MNSVYLAGASKEVDQASRYIRRLLEAGIAVQHDWTSSVQESRAAGLTDASLSEGRRIRCALQDLDAVSKCDLFWLLIPSLPSIGSSVELGYALALSKPLIVSGDAKSSIFFEPADRSFRTHDDAFIYLVDLLG